jgi:hypothetical protein
MVASSWESVKSDCIEHCWHHAGLTPSPERDDGFFVTFCFSPSFPFHFFLKE